MKASNYFKMVGLCMGLGGFCPVVVSAQTYPKIQEISLRAPVTIKVDGKATEWNDKLQAYNYSDRILYTLSNDDNRLYLTVRAPGPFAIDKILRGGITLTISHSTEKKDRENEPGNVSVTFPKLDRMVGFNLAQSVYSFQNFKRDTIANRQKIDSLITTINKQVMASFKEVQINGFKGISEPLISVYNTEGIQVMAQFNKTMAYVYELTIPLKLLGMSIIEQQKFSYNIKLNGDLAPSTIPDVNQPANSAPNLDMAYINAPTDFWAEYTLAK